MKKSSLIIIAILILASVLRIYNLGENPPAAYGDEISFGWNAWSILNTGTDEYGTPYPLQFRAFDDYKAPIPVYLLVPFLYFLGLNTFAVRLPVVLFAVGTVYVTYLLGREIGDKRDRGYKVDKVALLAALLMAISPWHIHLSRGYFESTMALFFFVAAVYLFVSANVRISRYLLSAIFFALTIYTYFTPRMLLILFIPFIFLWKRGDFTKIGKQALIFLTTLMVLSLPLAHATFFGPGLSRIDKLMEARLEKAKKDVIQARFIMPEPSKVQKLLHNRPVYVTREILTDYLEHFSLNFWYLTGDSSLRYFIGNMGMFYLIEMPFFIYGLIIMYRSKRKYLWLLLGWLALAPIPAAIAGRPFAVRSLAMLPAPFFVVGTGLVHTIVTDKRQLFQRLLFIGAKVVTVGLFTLSFAYYLFRYHIEYPLYAGTWWGWENKASIDLGLKDYDKYDNIFLSNHYTGIELALVYYLAYDPDKYREAKANRVMLADNKEFIKIDKFYVGSLDIDEKRWAAGVIPPKSLYIGRPAEKEHSSQTIRAPEDGRILFEVYRVD